MVVSTVLEGAVKVETDSVDDWPRLSTITDIYSEVPAPKDEVDVDVGGFIKSTQVDDLDSLNSDNGDRHIEPASSSAVQPDLTHSVDITNAQLHRTVAGSTVPPSLGLVKVEPDDNEADLVTAADIAAAKTEGEAPMLAFVNDDEDIKPSLPSPSLSPPLPLPDDDTGNTGTKLHEPALLVPHGLPSVQAQVNNQYAYLFFRFCAERHKMWERRRAGVPRAELSADETMTRTRVGNIYRQLDPSGEWLRQHVICVGDQSQEEICCECNAARTRRTDTAVRLFLYSAFYMGATWQALVEGLGHIPSWRNFNLEAYEAILHKRSIIDKRVIYYSGFQLVPPVIYFGRRLPHYAASLRMVKAMMEMGLPARLAGIQYAVDASEIIRTVPTFGGFLSLCLLCSLNEVPGWKYYYRNFATCGPGSRGYLKRLFGERVINSPPMEQAGLRWLYENQWRYTTWPAGEWRRVVWSPVISQLMIQTLDCENSLCWAHRYVNDFTRQGFKSLNDLPFPRHEPSADEATFPAWCDEEKNADTSSKAIFEGDYEEEAAKLDELVDIGEEVYEVERIVCRKGNRTDRNGLFRVRWKGYPPEEDTWERASSLKNGSQQVLDEWTEWEESVFRAIARIKDEEVYKGPMEGVRASTVVVAKRPRAEAQAQRRLRTAASSSKKRQAGTGSRPLPAEISRDEYNEDEDDEDDIVLITEEEYGGVRAPAATQPPSSLGRPPRNRKQPERLIDTLPTSYLPLSVMDLGAGRKKKGKTRLENKAMTKLEVDMAI